MNNENWDLNTAEKVKIIKVLVYEESENLSLIVYLSSISDLAFSTHASEMRYGETFYFRGIGKNVKATIIPTITLTVLPRKYRKHNWFYVIIYCHPEDTRFDDFPGYITVTATQYNI